MKKYTFILGILVILLGALLFYLTFRAGNNPAVKNDFGKNENIQNQVTGNTNDNNTNVVNTNVSPIFEETNLDTICSNLQFEQDKPCCETSVAIMKKNNYPLADKGLCPRGYISNILECPGSLTWCERMATTE